MNSILILATISPNVQTVVDRWQGKVEVDVAQAYCGTDNAFYFGPLSVDMVVICRELSARPAVERFIVSHEMAHAFFDDRGMDDAGEREADELALLMSTKAEAYAAAAMFDYWADIEDDDTAGDDGDHQSHRARAAAFRCVAQGLHEPETASHVCRMYAQSLVAHWRPVLFP